MGASKRKKMIQHTSNTETISNKLKSFATSVSVYKELGEPILCHPGIEFMFWQDKSEVLSFVGYQTKRDHVFLRYAYTATKSRNQGYFSLLLEEMEESIPKGIKTIKAVATDSALSIYLKRGYTVSKSYTKFHKIEKKINND